MGSRHSTPFFFRAITLTLLVTFLSTLLPMGPIAEALSVVSSASATLDNPGGSLPEIRSVGQVETRYGLVALLVDEDLWDSQATGSGFFSFFGGSSLSSKIQTYAQDIQAAVPWTKTIILTVSSEDTPVDIQRLLEKLYFEGNPDDSDPTKLSGVVAIGGVPLPVVNKNGYLFASMLPYTDFAQPAYILDESSQDFLPNSEAQELQPEVWHGLIVPPLKGQDGVDLLSTYFDKNHAFHTGDADATTFDQKAFVADLVTEESTVNPVAFGAYERFLNLWEEISYYRYSNDLLTDVYTDMQSTVEEGDQLDNDFDGSVDEEANNGMDDDGDGYVDEDLGDGFYGIDNDGDCTALSASAQDSNGDGRPCGPAVFDADGNEVSPKDSNVDEDGAADNNNDADWVEGFEDRAVDEDAPGDTTGGEDLDGDGLPDGDGCPGFCFKDDNGDAADNDADGYPDGLERVLGTDPTDEKDPWPSVANFTCDAYGECFGNSPVATAWWANQFIDQFYGNRDPNPTCYADDGSYHPEWDDDEDGFCDEDGTTQVQLWVDGSGTPGDGVCTYNDGDCDGTIDEDPEGLRPTALFDNVPDIQTRPLIKGLTKKYAELFDQPQGVFNRIVNETGRYKTQYLDDDGNAQNDYDSSISLIAKKDEAVLSTLRAVNDQLEDGLDDIVKNHLAMEIPLVALLEITGSFVTFSEDSSGNVTEDPAVAACTSSFVGATGNADLTSTACLQFFNSSAAQFGLTSFPWGEYQSVANYVNTPGAEANISLNGTHAWEIDNAAQCTLFAGTEEEGGQLTQFNDFYSSDTEDLNQTEIQWRKNCVAQYVNYKGDIDEVCNVPTSIVNLRNLGGAKKPDEGTDTSAFETGPAACFEFREWTTYVDYLEANGDFNDWLTGKIREFSRDGDTTSSTYSEFLQEVEDERAYIESVYGKRPEETTLKKHYSELDLLAADTDHDYTVTDLMRELGLTDLSDDTIDTYLALNDGASISYPQEGSGMDDVSQLDVSFDKYYYKEGSHTVALGVDLADFTMDPDQARHISSFYKHAEPTTNTLNKQIAGQISPDMPIDATRRVSFIDGNQEQQTISYVNVFDATTSDDVLTAIQSMADALAEVDGGSGYKNDVEGFADEINLDQLDDALAWSHMSIDEKHTYVMTHYLGDEEAITGKARDGYEVGYIVADGDADSLQFAFNGNKPASDEDLEWLYRSQDAIDAALAEAAEDSADTPAEPLASVSNTTPVPLDQWITAIQEWLQETNDSLTNFGSSDSATSCGDTSSSDSGSYTSSDANDDGIPDGAEDTVSLLLSTEDNSVLQAGGTDLYTVTVSAKKSDGSLNTDDDYTEVVLDIVDGESSVTLGGSSYLTLRNGVATFALFSADEGSFTVQASADNRDDVVDSNTLSGSVVTKLVKITSYVSEDVNTGDVVSTEGELIEIKDDSGAVVATLDPATGALELDGARAVLKAATPTLPTRVAIESETGETYGVLFVIPEVKRVSIGDGLEGVFVNEVAAEANAAEAENGIALEVNSIQMGLVTATGQIGLSDGYSLDFDNPGEINLYEPFHVKDSAGNSLFTVTVKHPFVTGNIVAPTDEHEDYLSFRSLLRLFTALPRAFAETVIPDEDSDSLDDLEEWTIGTDLSRADTDNDFYPDGLEVSAGYDPLAVGKKLFTDIDAGNPAYSDLAKLYVRGVVKGYSDGSFKPNNAITREEFVKIDLGAICKQCDQFSDAYQTALMAEYKLDPFPDTDINPELLACVAEAKTSGIVSGYAGGSKAGYFVPTQNISRAEATKVLVETGGYTVAAAKADEQWYDPYVTVAEAQSLFPDGVTVNDSWLQGSITRAEFVQMAVNLVEAKDCRTVDADGDGLSDTEETVLYDTNPEDPDTDHGGVHDLEEVVRDSDPLDAADDFPSGSDADTTGSGVDTTTGPVTLEDFSAFGAFDHEAGVYAVSNQAAYEQISSSQGAGASSVNVYTNEIPADGSSSLYVRAEIRDQDGNIYTDDNSSIVEFTLSSATHGVLARDSVLVQDGLAETSFSSTEMAGDVTIQAQLRDGSLPSEDATLSVYAGEPVALELSAESSVIPAGGEAADEVTLSLFDRFGNVANHGFYSVTLDASEGMTLLDVSDEDTAVDGTQITTPDGQFQFRVLSSPSAGTGTVSAFLTESPDLTTSTSINMLEGMSIQATASEPYMFVGNSTPQSIALSAVDSVGLPLSGFQGDVTVSMSDAQYGSFDVDTVSLVDGAATVSLTAGTLAGIGSLIASSAGLEAGSTSIEFKPADPYELRIRTQDGSSTVAAGSTKRFIVESFDAYGNMVSTDSSTTGTLRLTDTTASFGTLSSGAFTLNQGSANFSVNVGQTSGTLNIVAAASGLLAGTWGGDINYDMDAEDFAALNPQMLYANVLGGPFGDVTTENYLAGWMTFNGKTQAVATLLSEPSPHKPLASIDAHGAISLSEDGFIAQTVQSAGKDLPTLLQWRSLSDDTLQADLFYVLSSIDSISTTLLGDSTHYSVENTGAEILLREDSVGVVKIRSDGQVVLLDPQYILEVNGAADGLGFVVMKNAQNILTIDFTDAWDTEVEVLDTRVDLHDWSSYTDGIYIRPTVDSEHNFMAMPTGNSTANPMGQVLVDPTEELAKDKQPSLGYTSLESAEDDGTVGWENENKNMLLFSAGNTVGQSTLYYPSEVSTVIGDPTISLPTENETNALGYTSDLGTLVDTSSEELLELLNVDYNGDDKPDVLAVYADGEIDVLQNYDAAVRLQSRGELLNIANGIDSIDSGDFNGDGLDDLFIVTKEACYAEEMCAYVYQNIGGGFVAQNVDLDGVSATPRQVEVADLNNDDLDDVVLVDENMVLYTVWNIDGELSTVDEIKDFGLTADSSVDLMADVAARYDGLESGSVTLPVDTTDLSSGSDSVSSDLQAFVDAIGGDGNFTTLINGSSDGTVTRKENLVFDYADASSIASHLTVSKFVDDEDGGSAEMGDTIRVSVRAENVSGGTLSDVYLSDYIAGFYSYDKDSLVCDDCSGDNLEVTAQKGDLSRPFVFGPLLLSAGQSVSLSYTMTVSSLPLVNAMVGNDLYSDYTDDDFPDIAVSLEGNVSGQLQVYYSNGSTTVTTSRSFLSSKSYERVSYQEKEYSPSLDTEYSSNELDNPLEDNDGDGVPDFIQNMDPDLGVPVPTNGTDIFKDLLGATDSNGDDYYSTDEMFSDEADTDGDGYNDVIDDTVGTDVLLDASISLEGDTASFDAGLSDIDASVSELTETVDKVVSALTCNGGCISFAGSIAFLAPGMYHEPTTGMQLGPDQGTPIFGITPNPPYVCAGTACLPTSQFRLYLAPTTTLGIGMGICVAPYNTGTNCIAFNIPLLQLLGVCDAINGFIADGMSKASDFLSGEDGSTVMNVPANASQKSSDGTSSLASGVFDNYVPDVATNTNIQVPGFPSIFTEWWKAQKQEFFKMLDLPDVTFIYPDPKSFTTEFTGIRQKALNNQTEKVIDLDQNKKVEELTSGVMGLEKFLNWAHALPLVDIKTKDVYIRYPTLTDEEIELVKRDAEDWVTDTKNSWKQFKDQFDLRADVTEEQKQIVANLENTVNEAISAVETNMAILESYTQIPEQILEIRQALATYAKVIICYLDTILQYTAGYLTDNVARVQAWAQWVEDLKKIVDGWRVLIDLSTSYMDSCDKCTNQRWNGMQLMFSLLVFIPDFPVIEMPKLPDIVIDVSHIQAGVDIEWPDVHFIPQTVVIPKLPRLVFPNVNVDVNADIDFDIDIPTLPQFDINVEFPELPALSLPQLPTLPPPPELPEIDPTLKSSLKIVSSILKIYCIIRQGFFPTQETSLKTKIEDITERPGTVMPFDLATTVEWPKFSFDFLKKIQIDTYLNLTADFSGLYDIVNNLGEQTSDMTQDFTKLIDDPLQDFADQIQQVLTDVGDESVDVNVDVSTEGSVDLGSGEESYVHPAVELAQLYSKEPLVMDKLNALKTVMGTLQDQIDTWAETIPDDIHLIATDKILALDDPLLHRYDSIKNGSDLLRDTDFLAGIEGTPLASVLQMKDSMISYVENLDTGTAHLKNMNSPSFLRYLAQENTEATTLLAGQDTAGWISTAEQWDPASATVPDQDVHLASDTSVEDTLAGVNLGSSALAANTGLYIYNSAEGVSTRLIDYTHESDKATHVLMVDLDGDDDQDVVYSMGGDVYIKENHLNAAELSYVTSDPTVASVSSMTPSTGNPKNHKRGKDDYQEASFAFNAVTNANGYEVTLYDSLDAEEAAPTQNVKRVLLLPDEQNPDQVFSDAAGQLYNPGSPMTADSGELVVSSASGATGTVPEGASSNLPEVYESRLMVTDKSGDVSLKNAYKRSLITENGELETEDGVLFQTIEDTEIDVTEGSDTTVYRIPAGQLINLGHGKSRTIRVDSGSVYWIDETLTEDEQELSVGMEILPKELVVLNNSSATVDLVTTEGAVLSLDHEEIFVMDQLVDASNPNAQVELENGAYYSVVHALLSDGTWGTVSEGALLNPQVCADDAAPFPVISEGSSIDLAIFSTTTLSAESSFDSDSEIYDAYWDLDDAVDANGDGILNNDTEVIGLTTEIGPYEDTVPKVVTLYVTDAAGNTSSTTITVNLYVPEIQITDASVDVVNGSTDPKSPEFPFHLVREREGALQELGDGYTTDENGDFSVDMTSSDLVSVYDAEGNVIAQFNPRTKQIMVYDTAYDVTFVSADADWPSRLVVYETASGMVMASFVFVSDSSLPVVKMSQDLSAYDLSAFNRLTYHVVANEEGYTASALQLTAHDSTGNLDFLVTNTGNITIFDERYTVVREAADSLDDYLILDVYDGDQLELQIWPGSEETVHLETTDGLDLPASEFVETGASLSTDTHLYFEDISTDDPLYSKIAELVERGVLEGYSEGGKRYFKPDDEINRAEFTKIILGILCIVPRDEAYAAPTVFNDILDSSAWYFAVTKESYLLNLITGYLGETDADGVAPFKPDHNITRAEGAKIMLEALNEEGIITLPDDLSGEPWYTPYIEIAQDLSPYMNSSNTAGEENFILTAEEAADPDHVLTRYEFVEMSVRVLQAYNCFDLDSDGDGLINFDEETIYGSDPYDPDTDAGGVDDGTEVGRGTDPLDASDDFGAGTLNGAEPGIYAIREACSACPCSSQIDFATDLMEGDQVFAIIENAEGQIFGQSNVVTITP